MPAANDDHLLWDDGDSQPATPAPRARRTPPPPAKRLPPHSATRPRRQPAKDEDEGGGNGLWIIGGIGIGVAVLGAVVALVVWGMGGSGEPDVAANPPPPAVTPAPEPVNPPPVNPPPVNPPPVVPPKPPAPVAIGTIPRPEDPAVAGQRIDVRVGARQPLDHSPTKLVVAAKRGLLVTMDEKSIRVYDPLIGKVVATLTAKEKFTDLSLTPDESAVMAADFGGELMGHGTPVRPHHVHRYQFAAGTAEAVRVKGIAHGLAAVTTDRFVLRSVDQLTKGTLNAWPAAGDAEELATFPTGYGSPIAFDPFGGRLIVGNSMVSRRTARMVSDRAVETAHAAAGISDKPDNAPVVLSTDGRHGYQGKSQFDPDKPADATRTFPEPILAAARDVAFGASGKWYRADNAQLVHQLPFKPRAVALARHGKGGWAVDDAGDLRSLEIREVAGDYVPPPAVEPTAEGPWQPPAYTPPANPFPAGSPLAATEGKSFRATDDTRVTKLAYAAAHDRLIVRSQDELRVLDAKTGAAVGRDGAPPVGRAALTSVSPDGGALFVLSGHVVARLDLGTGTWEKRALPDDRGTPIGLAAVAADRAAVSFHPPSAKAALALFRWGREGLIRSSAGEFEGGPIGTLAFDPTTRLVFALGSSRGSTVSIRRYALGQTGWEDKGSTTAQSKDAIVREPGRQLADGRLLPCLAATGGRVHLNVAVVDGDGRVAVGEYAAPVAAAAHDYVLTTRGELRDATTGKLRGDLKRRASAAAFAPDGKSVWVADERGDLTRFALAADAGGVVVKPPVNPPVNPPAEPILVADDWSPTKVGRPTLAAAPGTMTKLARAAVAAPGVPKAAELLHSSRHDRLLIAERNGRILVAEGMTLRSLPTVGGPTAVEEMTLTPDQSAVFASEKGKLFRLDLATLKWAARHNPFGERIVAVGADRLLVSDGPATSVLALVKWDADRLVPTAKADLPGPADLLRYDPAGVTAFVVGREKSQPYFARVTVDKGKVTVGAKVRLGVLSAGGMPAGRMPLSWDGSRLLGRVAIDTADGTEVTDWRNVLAASRDLAFTPGDVLAGGKSLRPALYPAAALATVSTDGVTVFGVEAGNGGLFRFTLSASAPVAVVPKGKIEDFKPTLFPRPAAPAGPLTKFTDAASIDESGSPTTVHFIDRHGVIAAFSTKGGLRLLDAGTSKPLAGAAPPAGVRAGGVTVAPDQSALFALTTDALHRYEFAAKKWDSRPVGGSRAVPLDGATVLLAPPVAGAGTWQLARWTADGLTVLGTADLPLVVSHAYDAATGHLYAVVRNPAQNGYQLKRFPVGGKPFVADWTATLTEPATPTPRPVPSADGKRVFAGKQGFDAATGKPAGDPLPEAVQFATHGCVLGRTGRQYDPDTGKELGQVPGASAVGGIASDGKSAVFYDRTGAKLRRFDITAGAVAPPPKKDPPVVVPPKEPKNPPVVVPFPGKKEPTGAAPKLDGLRTLPYAAGTQTVAKEVDRLPYAATRVSRIVAAESLGLVAVVGTSPTTPIRLLDLKTRKDLGLPLPVPAVRDVLAPPDHAALFVTDNKNVYRLNAARTGWDKGPLPPDTRFVLPLAKDRLFAVCEDQSDGTRRHFVHDLRWADGELKDAREAKLDRAPFFAWVGGNGRFQGLFSGTGGGGLLVAEYDLTDGRLETTWSVHLKPASGVIRGFRPSWDGGRLYRAGDLVDLTGPTVVESKPPAVLMAVSRDLLFGSDGEYYAAATAKPAGKFGHPVAAAGVTGDGKAVWVLDPDKKELVKYVLTDGK